MRPKSTALNTISEKANNQHLNTQNQSTTFLPSKNLNQNSHNTKQLASQEQQYSPIARPCSSQLQEISRPIQTHHQRSKRNIAMGNICVGYLAEDINKQDNCELFGLNSKPYLRDTCNIDFPVNNKTGKFKAFAFIRAPAHITDELTKLDDIAYHDNELWFEDATSTRKRANNNPSNESRKPFVVVNNYPENQNSHGRKSSAYEAKFLKREEQIVIFGDSIPRGIRLHEFNYQLHKGYAQLKSFPGDMSKELLYYMKPTLKSRLYCMLVLLTY